MKKRKYFDNLHTINDLVERILMNNPATRDSDELLYISVLEHFKAPIRTTSFAELFPRLQMDGFPSFSTVSRARRKVTEENPELKGTDDIKEKRSQLEAYFHEFFA